MDENTLTWAQQIQAEAERLTLKRIKDDKEERDRLTAETQKAEAATDNKKKA
jgi:hypothetical protein